MKELNKENFGQIVDDGDRFVVVDFWAPWCGFCRRLAPVMERLEQQYGDRVVFAQLNIDDQPQAADRFGIDTIPTLVLFRGGEVISTVVNPESQSAAVAWLKDNGAL